MDGACDLIGRAAFAVVAAAVMWRVDPLMTAAAFAPVAAAAIVSSAQGARSRCGAAALGATTTLSRFLAEVVNAPRRSGAGAQERVVGRLTDIGETRRQLSLRGVFGEALNSMNFHLVHVSTGAVLLLGASRIRSSAFTVGDFAMFVVFLDQLTPAGRDRTCHHGAQAHRGLDRPHARARPGRASRSGGLAACTSGRRSRPSARRRRRAAERLDVTDLTCLHPASGRGIDGASFSLERGTFTVVTGRVGAGKTTLLHALLGLLPQKPVRSAGTAASSKIRAVLRPPRSAFTPQAPPVQ